MVFDSRGTIEGTLNEAGREPDGPNRDWERVDARILGQILAAQNILFVLPDETRIAQFFSEVLGGVPGVSSCFFCFGNRPLPVQAESETCSECMALRKAAGETRVLPPGFRCGLAARENLRAITLGTADHTFGFLLFRVDEESDFEIYWPFLNNLANYIALSLENRLQKRMLEESRDEQLRKLSMAVDQSPVSVIMTNAAGQIEYVNPKFTSITGYSREEVLGKNPRILKSGETAPVVYQQLWEAITAGRLWRGELHNRKKNGGLFWESAAISAVRDQKGMITHFIAIKEDITERKHAEEELKRQAIRQRELERQLVQAQKLESLGTLASGIAHDFNNILAIIVGQSSLLKDSAEDPARVLRRIEAINKASERGASLVRQLLTFARKSESIFRSLSINGVIGEVVVLLRETLPKTIAILTNLSKEIRPVTADLTQIHQVLFNLCLNARDAMPSGGTITITTTPAGAASVVSQFPRAVEMEYVRVDVSDTGVGMDDETKQRIFEPFFTTKGPGKGTGLGLSLVYSIVESHHGMIWVESAPGKGTTFSFYLPVEDRHVEASGPAADLLIEIPGGSETVLLVEDEELLTEMVTEILAAKGYTVLSASDGEAGVALFSTRRREISVVLSDLGLPKLGGEEVFRRIRAIDPKARVIMASGFVAPEVRAELLIKGVKRLVQKPYQPSEVLLAIRTVLDTAE
jgi:two-component system cell cycle sensor histidine kinase/response regulator CckA